MERFEVAHIREQGIDLVITPLDRSFGCKTQAEQNEVQCALQACAMSAGLAGTVVPVWHAGGGRMGFLAPQNFHPFFRGLTLRDVAANINRELSCSC